MGRTSRIVLAAFALAALALYATMRANGVAFADVAKAVRSRRTVESVVAGIERKKPNLRALAESAGGSLRIQAFKEERVVEVSAPGWTAPLRFPMTAFSGTLGPKLREGDRQIPEGVYGIEYLNPNSAYHLSLKVSYPNASDRRRAASDGRTRLGGDIMIHGKAVTIGCIPIGDDAVEALFYLAAKVGIRNVSVVVAPYDMRGGRRPELETSPLPWYGDLCGEIAAALR